MQRWSDRRMERFIGGLLRVGVLLSASLVLVGAGVHLARHGGDRPDLHVFLGEPLALRGVAGIARGAVALDGPGLIQLGLLVLVATPVARVAFSVFAFAAQRDRTYVLVTLTVLAILCFGLFGPRT
jgi:uncharacterized membrane protein